MSLPPCAFIPWRSACLWGNKFLLIALIGAPVVAVILFEILLNGCAMFNHGNVRLPAVLDKYLRWLLVTPDVHRIHHSYIGVDTNSNYGFSLVFWDRLFHTYRAQPQAGHADITLGMPVSGRPVTCTGLWRMLVLPFVHVGAKPLATPLEKASRNETLALMGHWINLPNFKQADMHPTFALLKATDFPPLRRKKLDTLQVNIGYYCNQSCLHCHVNAGPTRKEMMSAETAREVIDFMHRSDISTLDLTGGAPELHEQFKPLIEAARGLGIRVIDRCNLTVLEEPGQENLAEYLARTQGRYRRVAALLYERKRRCTARQKSF